MDCLIDAARRDLTRSEVSKRGAAKSSEREPLHSLFRAAMAAIRSSDQNVQF